MKTQIFKSKLITKRVGDFLKMGVLALAITLSSCTKGDVGPMGPEGSKGEQGLQGEQGTQGEQGQPGETGQDGQDGSDGKDGNANVIASDWLDIEFDNSEASSYKSFSISVPELTRDVVDKAVILVYARREYTNGFWVQPLPYVTKYEKYEFNLRGNLLHEYELSILGDSMNSDDQYFNAFDKIRYVIIPPNSSTGKSSDNTRLIELKNAGIDIADYYQVAEYFGLED